MCYGMQCPYEDTWGECTKPRIVPCPIEDQEAHNDFLNQLENDLDRREELRREDEKICA